jgi:hypothetical protein
MYCTVEDMISLLPEPITVGDLNLGTPSPGRPQPANRSKLTPDEAIRYIRFAGEEIDSRLRPYYVCPLRRVKTYETEILENVSSGDNIEISVNDTGAFSKGQIIRLQSRFQMETTEVSSVNDFKRLTVTRAKYSYEMYESKISILEFPEPIPLITTRLAISYCFDQLFSAEQSPNISEYGKEQRRLALNSLDGILSGTVLLFGQDHTGKRFVRGSLHDAYQNPTPDFQFGREKQ